MVEELRDAVAVEGPRRYAAGLEDLIVQWSWRGRIFAQKDQLGTFVAAEGIGLGVPVHVAQGTGKTMRVVFGGRVVAKDHVQRRKVRAFWACGWQWFRLTSLRR